MLQIDEFCFENIDRDKMRQKIFYQLINSFLIAALKAYITGELKSVVER